MATDPPDLCPGQRVRVRSLPLKGHVRTPTYARGQTGIVERYCGAFPNPEELAVGNRNARPVELYRVRIAQRDLWPDYRGSAHDTVDLELYRHWLAPADEDRP